jgi:NADPH2:quinone reductase
VVINYGSVAGTVSDLDPIELGEAGSLWLTRLRLADYLSDRDTLQRRADDVFGALLTGELRVTLAGEYGFESVVDAHAQLEERRLIGKAVLRVV